MGDIMGIVQEDDFAVLYVGRLIQVKGILELMKAVLSIDDKHVKLLVVGSANFGDYVFIRDGLRIETINKRSTIIFKEFIKNYSSYKFDV